MRRRSMVSAVLTLVTLGGLMLVAAPGGAKAQDNPDEVTIVTDSNGIPHITASNFEALGYGEAWAFAPDDLCTLASDFVTLNGERSRYFGPDGLAIDYAAGTDPTNIESDLFWQSVKDSGLYQREMKAPPPVGPLPQVLQVYEGFVKGYNAYLASGKLNDPTCKGQPWVRPITLEDMFLRGVQIATESSSGQFIAAEDAAAPPTASTAKATSTASTTSTAKVNVAALRKLTENGDSAEGSNGIGVGRKDTQSGDGILLANPHFPWNGTQRFWMTQLTVPGQYDVEGGTLMGFPLVGIGFNSTLAWTHTVSTDQRFTFYELKLVPGHPTEYYLNGKATKMGTETVSVDAGDGATVTHTFYTTHWGTAVIVPPANYNWTPDVAWALDDVDLGNEFRAADQYFEMGRAATVQGLLSVEEHYLGTPLFNTIAADSHGNALYADVGNDPGVTGRLLSACLPHGIPSFVFQQTGLVTLEGWTTSCAWQTVKGTPIPGILSGSEEPHTIRTDYVENSNDSYWLANPSDPFPAYSPIIGYIDVQQGMRTRLGDQMIAERLAGTDGLGKPKFTVKTLQEMWESDRSLLADLVLKPLVGACDKAPVQRASNGQVVNLTAACRALTSYQAHKNGDLNATGGWLFTLWSDSVTSGRFWAVPFSAKHPLTTPNGLYTKNPDILRGLADAVLNLRAHHVPADATFGQVQHETRGSEVIPIPGCGDEIGCFNAIEASLGNGNPLSPGDYGEVNFGSSMVITAQLTPSGPQAQGILTYSQATNPLSPWYANMTRLFSQKKWVNLPYTARQLAALRGAVTVVIRF
jgi:acyl-homoserine-lactone acylase